MRDIMFSDHAKTQMIERGASKKEVTEAINHGESGSVKLGRIAYRKNFQYNKKWGGRFYRVKQVMPIVKKEGDQFIVITVYTFYF